MANFIRKALREFTIPKDEVENNKVIDNRSRIIINDLEQLCYITSGKTDNRMIESIMENPNVLKHSNLVIVINIYNVIDSLMDVAIHKGNLNIEYIKDDKEYIIIIGGSIIDYKNMIKSISDTNNNILQLIFQCLYQLDYRLFDDLIKDNIMMRDMFIVQPEINILNKPEYIKSNNIINIDDILSLQAATDGKFPIRKLLRFINMTVYYTNVPFKESIYITKDINFNDSFYDDGTDYNNIEWLGNNLSLNTIKHIIMTVENNISSKVHKNISCLFKPIGISTRFYLTKSIINWIILLKEFNFVYIKNIDSIAETIYSFLSDSGVGEDCNFNYFLQPEYINKVSSKDEIKYIDEVINEEIMSSEEYMQLMMEQEGQNIEEDNIQE